jgi:hypothetical protein
MAKTGLELEGATLFSLPCRSKVLGLVRVDARGVEKILFRFSISAPAHVSENEEFRAVARHSDSSCA